MKAFALFIIGLIAFAAIVIGGGLLFLVHINEERRHTCGKCSLYDDPLRHCWARDISVGPEDTACVGFSKKED